MIDMCCLGDEVRYQLLSACTITYNGNGFSSMVERRIIRGRVHEFAFISRLETRYIRECPFIETALGRDEEVGMVCKDISSDKIFHLDFPL